jgi:hypothetical protein
VASPRRDIDGGDAASGHAANSGNSTTDIDEAGVDRDGVHRAGHLWIPRGERHVGQHACDVAAGFAVHIPEKAADVPATGTVGLDSEDGAVHLREAVYRQTGSGIQREIATRGGPDLREVATHVEDVSGSHRGPYVTVRDPQVLVHYEGCDGRPAGASRQGSHAGKDELTPAFDRSLGNDGSHWSTFD